MRLISNVERDAFCRVLFKTLTILPVSCMCIMEVVCYITMNIGGLEQHAVRLDYNTHDRSDLQSQSCRADIKKVYRTYYYLERFFNCNRPIL
jgi:hypothetical protein